MRSVQSFKSERFCIKVRENQLASPREDKENHLVAIIVYAWKHRASLFRAAALHSLERAQEGGARKKR